MKRFFVAYSQRMLNHSGFSLPELLVSLAVLTLVLAGVFGVLSSSVLSFQHSSDQGANIQIGRQAMNRISQEIRNAVAIQTPAFLAGTNVSGTTLDYTSPDVSNPNRRIVLGTGADAKNVLILNRDNNAILETIGQGRVKASSLNFIRSGSDQRVLTVNLVLQSNSFSGSVDTPITTVVTTLNSGT